MKVNSLIEIVIVYSHLIAAAQIAYTTLIWFLTLCHHVP